MVVLIIDDQINVVSGIYFGVNWETVGVTRVLKAYNAADAKEILKSQIVDIMLCDIEMPVENGLTLFRWTRTNSPNTECIFLTAHADFLYAKEAIQLGGFDYILQPARYEEIEKAILRAAEKISAIRESQTMSSFGRLLSQKREQVLRALLRDNLRHRKPDLHSLLDFFKKFDIPLTAECPFLLALVHFLSPEGAYSNWDEALLLYAVENMLKELFEPYGQDVLTVGGERADLLIFIYPMEGELLAPPLLTRQLSRFSALLLQYFDMDIACYVQKPTQLSGLSAMLQLLDTMRDNNVTLQKGIFEPQKQPEVAESIPTQEKIWTEFLALGAPKAIFSAVTQHLQERGGSLTAEGLKRFYQSFMHLLSHLAEQHQITLNSIFDDSELMEMSLNSYGTVEDMQNLIHFADAFFEERATPESETRRQIERIVQYIRSNIDQEIRRTDIAQAVFLSPNYISRLFRNEMNTSLKDYILAEKMKLARSMIMHTKLPISVVAAKVGYTNFSYFSQVYKKINGNSPAADRKQ